MRQDDIIIGRSKTRDTTSPSFWRIVWKRFRRDRYAMIGLLVIAILVVLSYLAPVIANNKPIVMQWQGEIYYPAIADIAPVRWFLKYPQFFTFDFEEIKHNSAIALVMPIIPYAPHATALDEIYLKPSSRHIFGTDQLGRDVFSMMIQFLVKDGLKIVIQKCKNEKDYMGQ